MGITVEQERELDAAEEHDLDQRRLNARMDERGLVALDANQRVRLEDGRIVRLLAPVLSAVEKG